MNKNVSMICCLILSLAVSGCGAGGVFGPTLTPTSTITPVPTSTPTFTPTPLPPAISNEVCEWTLKSATLSETSTYAPQLRPKEGILFLTIEFNNKEGCSLAGIAFGGDGRDAVFEKATLPGGIPSIWVVDSQGNRFLAVEVGENYILMGVNKESSGFVLNVGDLPPLDLEGHISK
ncbi:hypothetical protein FBQ99_08095 [Chloroflexi bacterium CFX2]|nr:hypothetical protein [Chloroflexi bacterium CFX2]